VRARALGAGLLVVALALLFWPSKKPSPEDEVRALVSRAIRAAEHKELGPISSALADDFRGQGGLEKTELTQLLLGQFFRASQGLVVVNPSLEVTVSSPASAHFVGRFVFAGGTASSLSGSQYEIDASLERRDERWLLTSATWHQL
jgi:hypothetical protein